MPNVKSVAHQRLLFQSAALVMACDGEIHENEIAELQLAFNSTKLFPDLDFDSEFTAIIRDLNNDKLTTLTAYFDALEKSEENPVQRLQLLEIVLRVAYADQRVHVNEKKFIQLVLNRLQIPIEIVAKRFGTIDFLGAIKPMDKSDEFALADLAQAMTPPHHLLNQSFEDSSR